MKITTFLVATLIAASGAFGQQPNTFGATLTVNATQGPPYPITGVNLPTGTLAALSISGNANSPIVLAIAPGLAGTGFPTGSGLLDLSLTGLGILANGLDPAQAVWTTGQTGAFLLSGIIPTNQPTGVSAAYQAAVVNPTTLAFTLTAATSFTITPGITTLTIGPFGGTSAGSPAFYNVNLVPYGFTLPFYTQNYSSLFVSENGFVSFGSCNNDFTPTPIEFLTQMPRIAGFWTDVEPASTNCLTVTIDPTTVFKKVRVAYNSCPEFGAGSFHTFAIEIQDLTGDILIQNSVLNPASQLEQLTGITAGGGQSNAPQKNLSAMGMMGSVVGAPNEAFWEWFGLTTMPFYTAGFNNPFDLTGANVRFLGTNAGAPGAFYTGLN